METVCGILCRMSVAVALMLLYVQPVSAIGYHFVENYSADDPGNGGQTWSIDMYDDDWVYFANKDGVLQYDGNSWRVFSLNNGHDARALWIDRDEERVYVAGINEFGFLSPDVTGAMRYSCLSDSLGDDKNIGNMWGIYKSAGELVIQADYNVMRYGLDNRRMRIIPSDVKLDCSAWSDGILYIGTEAGMKLLAGNSIIAAPGAESLAGERIRTILPYGDGVIVATASSGLWFYSDGRLTEFSTGCDEAIRSAELFTAAVSDSRLAIGTILGGVILIDLADGSYEVYDEERGLQNNTVLSLNFDSRGNLWVGLDYGINRILLDNRTTTLRASQKSIGRGYAIAEHDGCLYLGTNRGLYVADVRYPDSTLRPVAGVSGQVWDLKEYSGRLLCMHDRGLFEIDGCRSHRVGQNMGTWTIRKRTADPSGLWVGTYTGIYAIHDTGTSLADAGSVNPAYSSFYAFVEDSRGYLWAYDDIRGIARMIIDPETLEVGSVAYYDTGRGFPATSQAAVAEIGDDIYFATDKGIYRYDAQADSIVASDRLNSLLGCDRSGCLWLECRGDHLFAMTGRELMRLCVHPDTVVDRIPIYSLSDKPMKIAERLYFLDDSTVVIPDYKGFTIYNFTHDMADRGQVGPVGRINELRLSSSPDSVLYTSNFLDRRNPVELPYIDNSICISYGVSNPEAHSVVAYRYRLSGRGWSEPTLATVKEYTDLMEGTYTFEVVAEMSDGSTIGDRIEFKVLPPWYRSSAFIAVYMLLVLGLIAVGYLVYRKRMIRLERAITAEGEQKRLSQQTVFEQEMQQKESEIEEMRRQKMQSELDHKSQEVVNLLLTLSRSRETMLGLKEELFRLSQAVGGNPEARKIITLLHGKINANMESDSIMERIEKEFDIVNDGMIKKLRKTYPSLSSNEVLMCAYLRMNLSSKEIAPLLNLSLRGVETMRYRLRKKFGLDRDVSITDFIMSL